MVDGHVSGREIPLVDLEQRVLKERFKAANVTVLAERAYTDHATSVQDLISK